MSPQAIVSHAVSEGLGAIALTDHNSCKNAPACASLCEEAGIGFLAGLEVAVREEAHVLCLFDTCEQATRIERFVHARMPRMPYNPHTYGDQAAVDVRNRIIELVPWYLGVAADCTLEQLCTRTLEQGGLCIPSHIDRPVFSVPAQLGFLPRLPYSALEISANADFVRASRQWNTYAHITGSDAHVPEDIGAAWIEYDSDNFCCAELAHALQNKKVSMHRRTRKNDTA